MKIFAGSRGNGKTSKILKLCSEDPNGILVSIVPSYCMPLMPQKGRLPLVITPSDFLRSEGRYPIDSVFYFDNLELMLAELIGVFPDHIGGIALCAGGPASLKTEGAITCMMANLGPKKFREQFPVEAAQLDQSKDS